MLRAASVIKTETRKPRARPRADRGTGWDAGDNAPTANYSPRCSPADVTPPVSRRASSQTREPRSDGHLYQVQEWARPVSPEQRSETGHPLGEQPGPGAQHRYHDY